MSIWFMLWLTLSAALLYFLGWTMFILYTQKTAWKAYAKKKKLRYDSASMMSPPSLNGPVGKDSEYSVSMFTGEHMAPDARGSRKLNAIEIQLDSTMPVAGGVANAGMVGVLERLNLKDESRPDHPDWDKSYVVKSESRAVLDMYLTPERVGVITGLMKIRNGWVILVFKDDMMLLRFDTPDPLASEKKLDLIIKKMVESAKRLELEPGEASRLKGEMAKKPKKQATIDVSDDVDTSALQLEDEGGEDAAQDNSGETENPPTEKS